MSSRRHLKSVADGVVRAFAGRNNDVDGWWAPGLILAAVPPGDPDYSVDLLTGAGTPTLEGTLLEDLGQAWARYLAWSFARHGLSESVVRSARLILRFEHADDVPSWVLGHRDQPFWCTVTIEDDRGRRCQSVAESHCSRAPFEGL